MDPELSRRAAAVMNYVRIRLSDEQIQSFIERLDQAGSFDKLSQDDKQFIFQLEKDKKAKLTT